MKASQTVKPEYLKSLHYLDEFNQKFEMSHYLVNTIEQTKQRSHETILSWNDIFNIIYK